MHANHLQITYYQFLLILLLMITEAVFAFREKRVKPFVLSGLLLIAAAGIGIGPNFGNLWSTYTYTKETMRGGSSELSAKKESKGGLQFDYAMMWSYSGVEHLNLIIPMYTGGGLAEDYSSTQTYSTLESLFKRQRMGAAQGQQANQYSGRFYWGEESLVNGGYYVGASIFMLFILSLWCSINEPVHGSWPPWSFHRSAMEAHMNHQPSAVCRSTTNSGAIHDIGDRIFLLPLRHFGSNAGWMEAWTQRRRKILLKAGYLWRYFHFRIHLSCLPFLRGATPSLHSRGLISTS